MHAADYDLTGQIMWPAAQLLADHLAANPAVMQGCRCALELGSGLGFPGILAAKVRCLCWPLLMTHVSSPAWPSTFPKGAFSSPL